MAIQELQYFPQVTLSENQGMVGVRQWKLDAHDDVDKFIDLVADSHFPGYADSYPIQIQSGAFWDEAVIQCRTNDAGGLPPLTTRTRGDLGEQLVYGATRVVAQYALHKMTNCWPAYIPKPYHLPGTTLSLSIRGSGQMLLVTPAGMQQFSVASATCDATLQQSKPYGGLATVIRVATAEYHISCDRLTRDDVDTIFALKHWDLYGGTVNYQPYLGAPVGTLLFDGYELVESYVCNRLDPHRYRLTASLKRRVIHDANGGVLTDDLGDPVGWNHDYRCKRDGQGRETSEWAWQETRLWQGTNCIRRHEHANFRTMFGDGAANCQPIVNPLDIEPLPNGDNYACA